MQVRPQITSPLEELAWLAEGEPTVKMKAVKLSSSRDTEPILLPANSFDKMGRFYLSYSGEWDGSGLLWDDTLYHTERLVEQYHEQTGCYPDEVCLSFVRYMAGAERQVRKYWPRNYHAKPIPFTCEADNVGIYEVLVRGNAS